METTHPNSPNWIGFSSSVTVQIWFPPGQVSWSICAAHFFCTPCILFSKLYVCFMFPLNWSTRPSPNCTARSRRETLAAECHRCSHISNGQKSAKCYAHHQELLFSPADFRNCDFRIVFTWNEFHYQGWCAPPVFFSRVARLSSLWRRSKKSTKKKCILLGWWRARVRNKLLEKENWQFAIK